MSVYHACASANKCKGLGEGIRGYHSCARKQNCKKDDRAKVAAVVAKIKTSKAKATLAKVVKKKVEVIRKPKAKTFKENTFTIRHYDAAIDSPSINIIRKRTPKYIWIRVHPYSEYNKYFNDDEWEEYKLPITTDKNGIENAISSDKKTHSHKFKASTFKDEALPVYDPPA
jgi:hypothetical protein